MTVSQLKTVMKITSVYVFALVTAVACAKFEPGKSPIKGATNNGTAAVAREGTPGPVTEFNVTINKVQTVFLGTEEFDEYKWSLKVDLTHGSRNLVFDIFPNVNPIVADAAFKTIGTMDYVAQGVCGTELCSKFAILIDIRDTSNGTTIQRVELWDLHQNNAAPLKRVTDKKFDGVTQAYEALTGEELPYLDGE
ncbi:MAG: hypothetical protein J0L82_10685 [Deltaproteobacteria bacterium]|jgi:hypothetical protein|nr:hypothetical protein [Deltaproteobacteria bacterium]